MKHTFHRWLNQHHHAGLVFEFHAVFLHDVSVLLLRSGSVLLRKTLPPFGPTSASSGNFLRPPLIGCAAVKPVGDAEPVGESE